MASVIEKKIDISLKIKNAFVSQINEPKEVSVIWRRGKRELESKAGTIDPKTHDAKIDDVFKMKTALEYDLDEYKFQPKMSILELIFHGTKQGIGYIEFDLGAYTNKVRDKTEKKVLDLKSDKFPGCQIYIYINIKLLDPLPAESEMNKLKAGGQNSNRDQNGKTAGGAAAISTAAKVATFDPKQKENKLKEQ